MKNKYIMSNDTTSIDKLPVALQANIQDPVQSALGNSENIKIENYGQQIEAERKANNAVSSIDYTSELNSVLKDAASSGATILPSRDIPTKYFINATGSYN